MVSVVETAGVRMDSLSLMAERAGRLDRLCAPPHRALGLALALAMGLGATTSCKRGDRAAERARQVAAAQTAPPAELLVQGGLRAPGVLIDQALQLVAGGMPLPLGREPIVQLALALVELPAAVAAALDLDRPLHFATFDARLGEHATLVALPIRSARAFGEALRATLEQRGREGALALWWPKGPAGQLRPLRVWNDERVALLAGSRRAFERGRAFVLGRLVPTPLAHDLVLRVHVPAGAGRELDRILRHQLTSLDGGSIKGNPLLGRIVPPAGQAGASAAFSAVAAFVASARAIELYADFDGSTLRLGGRAEVRPGGALARAIKHQRTAVPFGATLAPPGAWLYASLSRTPDPSAKDELLESLFRGAEQALPAAERAAFSHAAGRLRGRLIGDAALAVAGDPSGRGIGVTLLARLDGRPGAAGEVERVAQVLQRATLGPALPAGSRSATPVGLSAVEAEPLGLVGVEGRVLRLASASARGLARGGRPPSPASPSPGGGLFGAEGPQVGWLVGDSTLALVVASDARAVLAPVAAALRGGAVAAAPPALAQDPAFRAAAARAPGRSGLVYLAVDRLLEAATHLDPAQPASVGVAGPSGGPRATLTVDWGVDAPRQAFDAAVQLPLARVLALKQVITQLMSAAPAVESPSAPARRSP